MINERTLRRALIIIALAGLALGLAAAFTGRNGLARWIWAAGTIPVVAGLAISIARDFLAGRMGVDAVAFVSMAAALALGQTLTGVVVAIMYAGGSVLGSPSNSVSTTAPTQKLSKVICSPAMS
jgi:hypothetical protein